jgi:hypothetical protein
VTTGKVVGSVFFTTDQLFRVEELAISSGPDFIDDSRLKINKDSTRDVLPSTSFTEKGVESIVTSTNSFVTRHLAIRLHIKESTINKYYQAYCVWAFLTTTALKLVFLDIGILKFG